MSSSPEVLHGSPSKTTKPNSNDAQNPLENFPAFYAWVMGKGGCTKADAREVIRIFDWQVIERKQGQRCSTRSRSLSS
jgi:hypothetical protein